MVIVMVIVVFAVFIFAFELLRVDVAAIIIMTLLGLLIFVPGLEELLTPDVLFSGFSSNAVVSIIAVMIIGGGLDRAGAMDRVAGAIQRFGGNAEKQMGPGDYRVADFLRVGGIMTILFLVMSLVALNLVF